ncbi:MAG: YdeI/OmpD-associated family protein [Pseudomonadales bacterium]|nr:YdeI/OmpD-associated family protein [Pseudomonadales bacterium]
MKVLAGLDIVHPLPNDLKKAIEASDELIKLWNDITPLARNEFICWVEDGKQIKTRERRIRRTVEELLDGQRRPCCWIGCVHRPDKEMSASQKYILGKRKKKRL